jgi:magnesium transporter
VRIQALQRGAIAESTDVADLGRLIGGTKPAVWIDLVDTDEATAQAVSQELGLHPLVAEDLLDSYKRAKLEIVGDVVHLVLFALAREGEAITREIDFVLGPGYLLSVRPSSWDPASAHQLKQGVGPLLERGPDYLLWALVDGIVDGYFPVFDEIGDEIDDVQNAVLANAVPKTLARVFAIKRELITIRHVVTPTRDMFAQLTNREIALIGKDTAPYFRDVYDHLIRLVDEFDTSRELVAGTIEVYLSTVNNNLSVIMKRLTGVTVVLAGIGAVAGIGGMSEAAAALRGEEGAGFYIVTVMVILAAAAAVVFLRRIDWI